MRRVLLSLIIVTLFLSCSSKQETFYMPAEFEEQDAIWFVFPGRKLVWVECMPLNWDGGGIHCSTQQQPKKENSRQL